MAHVILRFVQRRRWATIYLVALNFLSLAYSAQYCRRSGRISRDRRLVLADAASVR